MFTDSQAASKMKIVLLVHFAQRIGRKLYNKAKVSLKYSIEIRLNMIRLSEFIHITKL